MARPKGQVAWHAAALTLQAGGAHANEITKALANLPSPPSLAAVRKFLNRAHADPHGSLQAVAAAGNRPPIVPALSDEDNRTFVEIAIALERHRARVLKKVLMEAEAFLDTPHRQIEQTQLKKFFGAVELLKALKSANTISELEKPAEDASDDLNDRRRAVHERLAELAALDA